MERERVLLAGISLHQSSKALYTAGLRGGASTQSNTVALDSSQKTGDIICTNKKAATLQAMQWSKDIWRELQGPRMQSSPATE
ncbi:hypothetical protein PC116_g14137 [Phytophthora cactorum]|uniref:Uncharacterized protein n=1 Tax=Phytophthora cactorum TaxID=29920 RepID=A0A8T1CL79_9STRA|nr:hypothetical protein PC117_g15827 [Phytophthora cactorum]KAG3076161.1 hypothetical protein PC122_g13688 [Phytophthora cactorum]KAG3194075.1 hypothetical protein PC128_g9680 [Phytophthora cactorum]KAG4237827.1 hypothetical protein PC116_g14137 [Phytophthora cactorum]